MASPKGSRVPRDPNITKEVRGFLDDLDRKTTFDTVTAGGLGTFNSLSVTTTGTFGTGLTVSAGGLTITAGGLTVTAGSVSVPASSIANASLVSPPIFTKSFTSSQQAVTSGGALVLAHSLGTAPLLIQARLVCQTGEGGYVQNDEVIVNPHSNSITTVTSRGISVIPDATNLNVRYGSNANAFEILRADTGANFAITNANWKLVLSAWA